MTSFWLLATLVLVTACEPELVVGAWSCNPNDAALAMDSSASETQSMEVPWSTGFESEFCDFERAGGFCYAAPLAEYKTVTSPVHSGRYAAAFRVRGDGGDAFQTRCVRKGVLPTAAYYGAWYFIPESASNSALWNLVHVRGNDAGAQHGLWDISLMNRNDGSLEVVVFDHLRSMVRKPANAAPIPIGAWFHLELYLRRAADATGEVALYQDGLKVLEATRLITDDTSRGQWYVGNLATGLTPAESIVYVDDITLRSAR
jgi:hypothetical protein